MNVNLTPLPKSMSNKYDDDSLVYEDDDAFLYSKKVSKKLVADITNREFQIYTGYYVWSKGMDSPNIFLVGRGKKSGKATIKIQGYYPYCMVYSMDGKYETYLGAKVEKIMFRNQHPSAIANYRKRFEKKNISRTPFEADIPFIRRFLCDCSDFFKPKELIMPKVGILDIETDFPYDNDKIISFALNGKDEIYFNSLDITPDEGDLLLDLMKKMDEYDVLTGWNFIKFDMDKIEFACEKLFGKSINVDPKPHHHVASIDLKNVSAKMYAHKLKGGWSLDNTGKRLCGIGKRKIEKNRHPRDMEPDELMQYNVMDTIVPEIVDNLLGGLECHLQLSRMLGCKLGDTELTAIINDISIIKAYHKQEKVLPSRPPYWLVEEEKKKQDKDNYAYKAAEPAARPGTYYGVVGVDLSAAYPSSVLAINASCETKDFCGKYRSPDGVRFNADKSVFIQELKRLMDERYSIKRQINQHRKGSHTWKTLKYIDFALKTQVAAYSHGIFGWARSRMKDTDVAGAICATARNILNLIKYTVDKWGYKWIYCHTDSVYFLAPKKKAKELTIRLNVIIKDFCERNGWTFAPKLDFEGYYPKVYVHSPARKVLVDEDGEWIVTGCNFMRAEVPEPLANIEEKLIAMKLDKKTNDEMLKELKSMMLDVSGKSSEDLGIEKPYGKPIEKYGRKLQDGSIGGFPYHIKALQRAIDEYGLDIEQGDRFRILPIISSEITGVRVLKWARQYMAYPVDGKLPDAYIIDYEEYFRSNLFGKIDGLFGVSAKELEKLVFSDNKVCKPLMIRGSPKKDKEVKK